MSGTRRTALKMLGTIGATCAFPFAGDELYGQHVHPAPAAPGAADEYTPTFFTASEYAALATLTDTIVPPTDTPGAAAAGVPEYIDRVVSANAEHQPIVRAGLAWLDREARARFSAPFTGLREDDRVAMLQPVSDALDREQRDIQAERYRTVAGGERVYHVPLTDKAPPPRPRPADALETFPGDPRLPVKFFRLVKNLTGDGYYTSRVGLLQELGYSGNQALAAFAPCTVPEQ